MKLSFEEQPTDAEGPPNPNADNSLDVTMEEFDYEEENYVETAIKEEEFSNSSSYVNNEEYCSVDTNQEDGPDSEKDELDILLNDEEPIKLRSNKVSPVDKGIRITKSLPDIRKALSEDVIALEK